MNELELFCDYAARADQLYGDTLFTWKLRNPARGAVATEGSLDIFLHAGESADPVYSSGDLGADALSAARFKAKPAGLVGGRRYVAKLLLTVATEARGGGATAAAAGGSTGAGNAAGGHEARYSAETTFVAGRWKDDGPGRWISMPNLANYETPTHRGSALVEYHASYFRKSFTVDKRPEEARLFVCGLGAFDAMLNGVKLGDHHLDPPQTHYSEVATYISLDVDTLALGENVLGVVLGNGRYVESYGYGQPRLRAYLATYFASGELVVVESDESWSCSDGPIEKNGIYTGETYNAQKEMPGWDQAGFDTSTAGRWINPKVVDGPPLSPMTMDPIRSTETLSAVSVIRPAPGTFVFDFGQNISGVTSLTVPACEPGITIRVRHAELIDEDGSLDPTTNRAAPAEDIYVTDGRDALYTPRFTYHGFRYAEVTGYPGIPTVDTLKAHFVHTDVPRVGTVSCSDKTINAIHRNTVWGQLSNLMSIPTDCPQRDERQGWLGDAQLTVEEAILNFDMMRFYRKYLRDIADAQREDGSVSDVVPPYWELYPADPAWGTAYPEIAWHLYWYYGDSDVLTEHYEGISQYVDFLRTRAVGGILRDLGKYGDWCPPGSILPKKTPMELVATWYFYHDTVLLARIAAVLGKREDTTRRTAEAEEILAAFNAEFLKEYGYEINKMSPRDTTPGQTSNLLPLALNMVPADKREHVVDRLLHAIRHQADDHLDTGIVGTRYLFDVLTDLGRADLAFRIATQSSYPGWKYMLREGATTLWERWEMLTGQGMNSHNHIMLGSIDAWFYRGPAGLRCAAPGWRKIEFAPQPVDGLDWTSCRVDTVRGVASSGWEKDGDKLTLHVEVPLGATATVTVAGYRPADDDAKKAVADGLAAGSYRLSFTTA